jgi:DNA-binding NtrC family response regulator
MELTVYAIPALLALAIKVVLYFYVRPGTLGNLRSRLFLIFLIILSAHNLAEITYFITLDGQRPSQPAGGYVYYAAAIFGPAVILHFSFAIARNWIRTRLRNLVLIYLPPLVLEALLVFTPWLVSGFRAVDFTYYRTAGPLFFLFEYYILIYIWGVLAVLAYGALYPPSHIDRLKSGLLLLGLVPMGVLASASILVQHYYGKVFNATFTLPLAITFFLIVSAYATYKYRLIDIAFYIPWSKGRKRKTAFHQRIRKLISEIASLGSVNEAINRLSDALKCPVALVDGRRPVVAMAGGSRHMADIPLETLHQFEHIVVADEVADSDPGTYQEMQKFGIAAVVPFYPNSRNASGWLLLGNSFSDLVYSPLDFELVEQLFDRMGELFLDKLLTMRSQLANANRRIQLLKDDKQSLGQQLAELQHELRSLRDTNERLMKEQAADSVAQVRIIANSALNITLLGRNKKLRNALRQEFPQLQNFVGPSSAAFKRKPLAQVLICDMAGEWKPQERQELNQLLARHRDELAALLIGQAAETWLASRRAELHGHLVERLPEPATTEAVIRKAHGLARLVSTTCSTFDSGNPLIGDSEAFVTSVEHIRQGFGFMEPIWIKTRDSEQAIGLARWLHRQHGRKGQPRTVDAGRSTAADLEQILFGENGLFDGCRHGTLVFERASRLPLELQQELLRRIDEPRPTGATCPQLVFICAMPPRQVAAQGACAPELVHRVNPYTYAFPELKERGGDLDLLIHYFTLQFNLQAAAPRYLTRQQVMEMFAQDPPATVAELKTRLFEALRDLRPTAREPVAGQPDTIAAASRQNQRTLDELVGEYEASLIEETLKRCHGNKSKAARILGLKPNTLHYKLKRYGLSSSE